MTIETPASAPTSGRTAAIKASGPLLIPIQRTWWQRYGHRVSIWASRVLVLVIVLLAWTMLSGPVLDPQFVGSPQGVVERLVQWSINGALWSNSWITIQEVVLGFLLGA